MGLVRAVIDYRNSLALVFLAVVFAASFASTLGASNQGLTPIATLIWVVAMTVLAWRSWLSARKRRRAKE